MCIWIPSASLAIKNDYDEGQSYISYASVCNVADLNFIPENPQGSLKSVRSDPWTLMQGESWAP